MEININSQSLVKFSHSNFVHNTHSGLVYIHLHSTNITVLISNLNIVSNVGFSLRKTGGFIIIKLSEDRCIINLTRLKLASNQFASNIDLKGGGVYISGTLESGFKCYIKDSRFSNNIGFGSGAVIYNSLACISASVCSYTMSIEKCIFINNTGKSIVFVAMEYYAIPAFLIFNGDFINNTGIPLKLVNMILLGNGNSTLQHNQADIGAALHLSDSYILLNYTSFQLKVIKNHANFYGGGIYVDFLLSNLNQGQCHF